MTFNVAEPARSLGLMHRMSGINSDASNAVLPLASAPNAPLRGVPKAVWMSYRLHARCFEPIHQGRRQAPLERKA